MTQKSILKAVSFVCISILLISCAASRQSISDGKIYQTWRIVKINNKLVLSYSGATITFNQKGELFSQSACNSYRGKYVLKGQKLHILLESSTMKACIDELMKQEEAVNQNLLQVEKALVAHGHLLLLGKKGEKLIELTPDSVDDSAA